jgi:hypothetical protein
MRPELRKDGRTKNGMCVGKVLALELGLEFGCLGRTGVDIRAGVGAAIDIGAEVGVAVGAGVGVGAGVRDGV